MRDLIVRGIKKPHRVPNFIYKKLSTNKKFDDWYRMENGKVINDNFKSEQLPDLPEFANLMYADYKLLEDILSDRSFNRSLDVGCGFGWRENLFSEYAQDAYGLDISEKAIQKAGDNFPEHKFVNAPAQDMPFDEGYFDLISSWTVLMHMSDDDCKSAINEMKRVFDDSGKILIYEDIHGNGHTSEYIWSRTIEDYQEMFEGFTLVDTHKRREFDYSVDMNKVLEFERT